MKEIQPTSHTTVKPKLQWSYSYLTWAKYSHGHIQEILSTGNSLFSEMHILRSLSPTYHVFPPVQLFYVLFSAILWLHWELLPINGTSFSLCISFLTYFLNHRIIESFMLLFPSVIATGQTSSQLLVHSGSIPDSEY